MTFILYGLVLSLTVGLSHNAPVLTFSQPESTLPVIQNPSDESELRTLADAYYRTWAARDLDGFLHLWSASSSEFETRRKGAQELFAGVEKIELRYLTIRAVKVGGANARIRVEADARVIEAEYGKEKTGYGKMFRTLECVKESGHWKVWSEVSTYNEIATALATAMSELQRAALLAEERELVTADLALAMINRGARLFEQGDYQRALSTHLLALSIADRLGDQAGIAGAQRSIGNVYMAQSNYARAMEYYQKSLVIAETLEDKAQVSSALNSIGNAHYSQGDYAKSLECLQRGLALDEALEDKQAIAKKLNNIGRIHRVQGNYALAMRYYQKSLALSEDLKNNYGIALTLLNIGNIHRIQGDYAQAMKSYQKSLEMREAIQDRAGIASTLTNIGRVRYMQGSYVEAIDYLQKSLALWEDIGDKAGAATTLNHLGEVYEKQGDHAQALEKASRAVSLAREIGEAENLWKALLVVGVAYRSLEKYPQARQAFEESISIIETLREHVAGGGEEQQRFFESKVSPYHALVDLLTREGRSSEALTFAERAKARVLLDVLQTGRVNVAKALTGREQEQERKFRAELFSLNAQVTRASQQDKNDQARLDELKSLRENARLDYEAFQSSLYAAHPELRAQRGEAPVIKSDEIAALIPDVGSAVLEYVVTDEMTYLFAITKPDGLRAYTLQIKRDELAAQTENFRRQLAGRDLGFRASARRLFQLLLKPAQAQLRGKTNIVIVPDDKLWELPFEALVSDGDRYVIERSAVSYAPSLTVLREMKAQRARRQAEPAGSALIALGNPALGKATIERAALAMRDEKIDPLPESEQEVKALRRLYGKSRSKVYIGAEAREDRVKIEASQAGILHFATHGVLNDASPMYSYLALAQGDKNEDGLLEAWELMQLDLRADLVVLSACETARGRFGAGEGVIGLSWAMFVAGAPATLVSQWKVESASTRELMLGFHQNLRAPSRKSVTKAEALRRAALKLMKNPQTNHPFYWAGFVLVGAGQ